MDRRRPEKELLDAIAGIVGDGGLLTGRDVAARTTGWLRPRPCRAAAIVRPRDTEKLARVVSLCNDAGQPLVPVGGDTGLVDGALAGDDDLLLSTERMSAIEDVDVAGGTMIVQAGVPLQKAQARAAEAGLMLAVDFGARGSATIGGAVSTNAGGNAVIRYGMMREQVLGLEAVLADGTIVSSLNRMLKNNAGYDLKQLFIGTEGTLGVVTRIVLRLRPAMLSQNTALVAVDEFARVPDLLALCGSRLGGTLSAFEVLWSDFYDTVVATTERHGEPLTAGHAHYVLLEARGGDQQADAARFEDTLSAALERGLISDAAIAGSGAQRDAFWAIRDDIEYLMKTLDPAVAFDISLPIADADDYVRAARERLRQRWPDSFRCTTFGHLGDGNIHFILTTGTAEEPELREAMEIVYDALRPYGGSISAEHGIGLEKRPWLSYSRNEAEIVLMKTLKAALDPKGILNPGKVLG